eukprot:GHRR01007730.1.p1 GENE.GHRR01007730.1~~GHRR01007730.1.p1  ORF type:complete len:508 (+),score=284.63 GHRR01007730.1:502-2025(+)
MENNAAAIVAINQYMQSRGSAGQQQQQRQQTTPRDHVGKTESTTAAGAAGSLPPSASSYSDSVAATDKPNPVERTAAAKHDKEKWLNLGGQAVSDLPGTQADSVSSKEHAEAKLAMFKRGGRLRGPKQGVGGGKKGEQLKSLTAGLERKVANCLSCGKIYDCRNVTNDIIAFIDSGFICTFCGAPVAMTQQQRLQQAQQQAAFAEATCGDSGTNTAAAAAAQAIAFKDRLVEFDRSSQKRTTVIDDQSDFFEIDTNTWLSEEERAELRRRKQLEDEAAAARRNKVFVTLDLLGRKVLTTDSSNGAGAAGPSGASFQTATDQLRQQISGAVGTSSSSTANSSAGAAGDNTASESTGAANAGSQTDSAAALSHALAAIRNMRITVNPSIQTPPPVFVSVRQQQSQGQQQHNQQAATTSSAQAKQQQQHGKQAGSSKAQLPMERQKATAVRPRGNAGAAAARGAAADKRIQDDSIFMEFEAELLYDELQTQQQRQQQQPPIVQQAAVAPA